MKELVNGVINRLKNRLKDFDDVRGNVSAIPNENFPPVEKLRSCFIGVKDGEQGFEYDPSKQEISKDTVVIVIFRELLSSDAASLMGDGKRKGILEITKKCRELLIDDNLVDDGYSGARVVRAKPRSISASTSFVVGDEDETRYFLRQVLTMSYWRYQIVSAQS